MKYYSKCTFNQVLCLDVKYNIICLWVLEEYDDRIAKYCTNSFLFAIIKGLHITCKNYADRLKKENRQYSGRTHACSMHRTNTKVRVHSMLH